MTGELLLGVGSAAWLGILTAISPCPLASNIAAISFISRRVERPGAVLGTGLLYACGRTLVYIALAMLLVSSLLSAPDVSHALQKHMNTILGPLLILVGMVLLGLIRLPAIGSGVTERLGKRVEGWGYFGSFALGAVFALSFCPASAALFFGSLIPLAVKYESGVILPLTYGIGTALPVIGFAVLIAMGARAVGEAFDRVAVLERWMRWITGVLFIGVGVYYALRFIFRLL